MAEKKPGFFKRLFKFGRKKEPAEEVESAEAAALSPSQEELDQRVAAEQAALELQLQEEKAQTAEAEQNRLATEAEAERIAAETEAERLAEQAELEKLAAREKAAREAAEQKVAQEAEAERLAKERQAAEDQAKREADEAQVKAEAKSREEVAKRKADAEQERQLELQRLAGKKAEQEKQATERKRIEAERLKVEADQKAAEEQARQLAEERLAQEKADQGAVKREAEAEQAEAQRRAEENAKQARLEEERLEQENSDRQAAKKQVKEAPDPAAETPQSLEPGQVQQPVGKPEKKVRWFNRLKGGLSRSSTQLTESITGVFTKRKLDDDALQDLEDILIRADLGVDTAMSITEKLAAQRMGKDVSSEEVRSIMADEIEAVLDPVAAELELDLDHQPHVILVVGVNGSGKTTTIGKLSQKLYDAGFSTLLVAGDTFRAAAIEQLKIWGDRTQSPVLSRPLGADAAGLAFDAYQQARTEGRDVMLMDTAGRLQNRTELMDELAKIVRVLKKQDSEAPHTVLLTLDATTGQNALNQVEVFRDIAGVNGIVMTKLDGTARGGILVAISAKHKLPVFFLGVGEQVDDLEPFEAREFARGIAGLN